MKDRINIFQHASRLRTKGESVSSEDIQSKEVQKIVNDIVSRCKSEPQIIGGSPQNWDLGDGMPKVIISFDLNKDDSVDRYSEPFIIFNPVIKNRTDSKIGFEGCGSIFLKQKQSDGALYPISRIERPVQVTVSGLNKRGDSISKKLIGNAASTALHEIDHVNGRLIADIAKSNLEEMLALIKTKEEIKDNSSLTEYINSFLHGQINPMILYRDNDHYRLVLAGEFDGAIPNISGDLIVFDGGIMNTDTYENMLVPTVDGNVPIIPSDAVLVISR